VHLLQIFAFPSGDPAELARLSGADREFSRPACTVLPGRTTGT
jgi:hypothetical protein